MTYCVIVSASSVIPSRAVLIRSGEDFTSFPAEVGNPNYDLFLESQSFTDAEVQAMEPDVWHDMA